MKPAVVLRENGKGDEVVATKVKGDGIAEVATTQSRVTTQPKLVAEITRIRLGGNKN